MKVIGIIAEYNPFHNGHKYHLSTAKQLAGTDLSLCVMSGSFLQRGEPALVNKWARAQMALDSGIDLVLELPTAYATRSAQLFAEGAVKILDASGIVTHLCFGSEVGSLDPLAKAASLILEEPKELSLLIRKHLDRGLVYPKAKSEAITEYVLIHNYYPHLSWEDTVKNPNNILGIEYLRALKMLGSSIEPLTVRRLHSEYNNPELNHPSIASATGIRQNLREQGKLTQKLNPYLSSSTWEILTRELEAGRGPVFTEDLFPYLLMKFRTGSPADLAQIVDVSEGLEYRIWEAAQQATSYTHLVDKIKTKRYTRTRIQRILLHYVLGLTTNMANYFQEVGGPSYLRVLGFNDQGRILLREIQKQAQLPIVTKTANSMKDPGITKDMLALDILATNVHAVLYPNSTERKAGFDYLNAPIYR